AVDNFNLELKQGEVLGLLGPNGSGKSTIISCIFGLHKYDSGNISIFGTNIKNTNELRKGDIGLVMQDVGVINELNVEDNINYFCGLYISDKKLRKQYVEEAINFVELGEFRKFKPKKLSGGLLRRLNLACGVAHKPKLIFFDEPTVAVDPQSRNKILENIKELNKKGATIVYTSHYMEEVEFLCDRITIIDRGKELISGTAKDLKNQYSKFEIVRFNVGDETKDYTKILAGFGKVRLADNIVELKIKGSNNNLIQVINTLEDNSISFTNIQTIQPTLNDVFLELTGKELRD
ncbi:MAG: ATP-binding cassette domain-containing protein, partial [Bacilli bacterium]